MVGGMGCGGHGLGAPGFSSMLKDLNMPTMFQMQLGHENLNTRTQHVSRMRPHAKHLRMV